jgi:hypothetical protein
MFLDKDKTIDNVQRHNICTKVDYYECISCEIMC